MKYIKPLNELLINRDVNINDVTQKLSQKGFIKEIPPYYSDLSTAIKNNDYISFVKIVSTDPKYDKDKFSQYLDNKDQSVIVEDFSFKYTKSLAIWVDLYGKSDFAKNVENDINETMPELYNFFLDIGEDRKITRDECLILISSFSIAKSKDENDQDIEIDPIICLDYNMIYQYFLNQNASKMLNVVRKGIRDYAEAQILDKTLNIYKKLSLIFDFDTINASTKAIELEKENIKDVKKGVRVKPVVDELKNIDNTKTRQKVIDSFYGQYPDGLECKNGEECIFPNEKLFPEAVIPKGSKDKGKAFRIVTHEGRVEKICKACRKRDSKEKKEIKELTQ